MTTAILILIAAGGLVGLSFADAPVWVWVVASLVSVALVTLAYVRAELQGGAQP